jgi:hypothetical protein
MCVLKFRAGDGRRIECRKLHPSLPVAGKSHTPFCHICTPFQNSLSVSLSILLGPYSGESVLFRCYSRGTARSLSSWAYPPGWLTRCFGSVLEGIFASLVVLCLKPERKNGVTGRSAGQEAEYMGSRTGSVSNRLYSLGNISAFSSGKCGAWTRREALDLR